MPNPSARFLITADDRASKTLRSVKQEVSGLSASVKGLALGFASAFSVGALVNGIVRVGVETDKLRASLETVTGSAERADAAFSFIKRFTAETPFQVNEVADAFIKLGALGIQPTEELLRSLGNTSSALGKSLDQSVGALAAAITGEFERLKDFGITASKSGDQVAFTFRGVTTVVKNSSREIQGYLEEIGNTDFAGATQRQIDTLGGAFSNLQDSVFNLADTFGRESGFNEAVKQAALEVTELIKAVERGDTIVQGFAKGIGIAIAELQVGEASLLAQRKRSIEELEEAEQRITNQLNNRRIRRTQAETESLEQRLVAIQNKLKVFRDSLDDPEFLTQSARGINAARSEDITPAITGPLVPLPSAAGAPSGPSASERRAAANAARDAARAEKEYQAELQNLLDTLFPVDAETRAFTESVELLNKAFFERDDLGPEKYAEAMRLLATDTEQARIEQEKLAAQRDRLREEATSIIVAGDERSQITQEIARIEGLRANLDELRDQYPELGELSDALADKSLDLGEAYDAVGQKGEEAADKTRDAWQQLGPVFASAFEDAIVQGKGFSDILKGIEQDIIRIATRELVTDPLGGQLSKLFAGFGTSFRTSFGLPGAANGADFTVRGGGGTDSQLVAFMATPGEQVQVTPPTGSKSVRVVQNFNFPSAEAGTFRRNQQQIARAAREALNS